MADEVQRYQEALRRYEAARAEAVKIQRYLSAVGEAMRVSRWEGVEFGPMPPLSEYQPLDRRPTPVRRIDLERWPSAQQIKTTIEKARQLLADARTAWSLIPEADRVGLMEPTDHSF